MNTALDAFADWILINDRMDLVEAWFRQLEGQVANAKNRVIKLTYSGIIDDTTPQDVLRLVRHNLTQALFIHGVASSALAKRLPELNATDAARIESMASIQIQQMDRAIEVMSECEELIASVVRDISKAGIDD